MADARWDVPATEEGLQTLLARLAESRAAGDDAAAGWGLLRLAWLVKWVRSDNEEDPFARSHTLAREALETFRRVGDERGTVRALHAAAPFAPPEERAPMLEEADRLAAASGDEVLVARSLAAQARATGVRDRAEATRQARQALEIFLRHGEKASAAACLFGLALYPDDSREKFEAARESARLYREAGEFGHAARSTSVAIMNGEEFLPPAELEPLARQGLADAQADGNRSLEGVYYGHLAKIATAKGEREEAQKYLRWQKDMDESDGLTPRERRESGIETTKALIAMARASGDAETAAMFEKELRRLERMRVDG